MGPIRPTGLPRAVVAGNDSPTGGGDVAWRLLLNPPRTDALPCGRFVGHTLAVGVHFIDSADKHRVSREDSLYASMHAEASAEIEGLLGEITKVYVGHPHAQTDDYGGNRGHLAERLGVEVRELMR